MAIVNYCRHSSATINNSNNFSEQKNNKRSIYTDSLLAQIHTFRYGQIIFIKYFDTFKFQF